MTLPIDHYLHQADAYRQHIHRHLLCLLDTLHTASTVMAQETQSTQPRVKWETIEVDQLVDFLYDHRSEGGDGGNFKEATLSAAVVHLRPYYVSGRAKDLKSVRNRWSLVSAHSTAKFSIILIGDRQLKQKYSAICVWRRKSGVHWDNIRGADIHGDASTAVFDAHVANKVCL